MRLFALPLVVALAACGGKSKPSTPPTAPAPVITEPEPTTAEPTAEGTGTPTPSDAELDGLFARTLDFLDELATGVDANAKNCKLMATEIDRIFNKHQALLAEAKSFEGNTEVDQKADAYMLAHQDRVSASTSKMVQGMQACANDPDVQAVMKRFDEL